MTDTQQPGNGMLMLIALVASQMEPTHKVTKFVDYMPAPKRTRKYKRS